MKTLLKSTILFTLLLGIYTFTYNILAFGLDAKALAGLGGALIYLSATIYEFWISKNLTIKNSWKFTSLIISFLGIWTFITNFLDNGYDEMQLAAFGATLVALGFLIKKQFNKNSEVVGQKYNFSTNTIIIITILTFIGKNHNDSLYTNREIDEIQTNVEMLHEKFERLESY